MEFSVNRLPKSGRYTPDTTTHNTSQAIAGAGGCKDFIPGWTLEHSIDFEGRQQTSESHHGKRAGHNPAGCLPPGGTASASAMCMTRVLNIIGIVSVIGPRIRAIAVISTPCILIADDETYGCAGAKTIVDSRQNLSVILLAACGGRWVIARTAFTHKRFEEFAVERYTGGHAVNDTAYCRTVTLTKIGEPEESSQSV